MALPLKRMAAVLPLAMLGGAGVGVYTSGEPNFTLYRPSADGGPSLAMKYLNSYREGMRPMTQAPEGYGTGKFGGVKMAGFGQRGLGILESVGDLLGGMRGPVTRTIKTTGAPGASTQVIRETVEQAAPLWKRLAGVGVPLVGGAIALEALDPLSDVLKPVATSAGERMSENLGLAPTPWEQTIQKGIDALAVSGAKELTSGMAAGVGAGARAGVGLMSRPASFETMVQGDPILSQAPSTQLPLLQQSYQAMQRVAPQLSQEPFVTKNFLRDIMVTDTGPDHATLSSLARSEQTIADAQGSVWGGGRR